MKHFLFIFFLLLLSEFAGAQYFQTGEDPASIRWRQINTDHFQLIYPDYYEKQAQLLSQKLEKVYAYASYSLHHQPSKISILLHTQTVQSNGLVAYAPKRSEFYTTPNQAIYPLDWLEQLAVHEFRHVVQIDKLNAELPAIIKLLLGEQGTALVFGAYLPWWFIEGDAVVTETALSNYGRGRLPSFLMEHRAQLLEKGKYSYDKAYNGSYKDYVPDHYNLGYFMVGNTRARYGADVWEKVMTRVGSKPFSFTPFNTALKQETGFKKVGLYNSIFDSLTVAWQKSDKDFHSPQSTVYTKTGKTYTSYTFGHWLGNSQVLAYKTSLIAIPSFVLIDKDGQEKSLHQPGVIFAESVNTTGDYLVWSEHLPSIRWAHSGLSLLKIMNTQTRELTEIKPEFKAFAPAISPDLTKIAVVEADFSSNYYLSIYDRNSGNKSGQFQTPENNYLLTPTWENDSSVICVSLTNNGKRLARIDLISGTYNLLSHFELGNIKQLHVAGSNLYFIADFTGKDAVFKFDLNTNRTYLLYEPRFGAAYPEMNESGELLLSDYTADGYRLLLVDEPEAVELSAIQKAEYPLAEIIAGQEKGVPELSSADSTYYETADYKKIPHIFNFHSWAPVFVDPYLYDFAPGASLMSQNVLGTAETILGYKWDLSERTGQFYASYLYKGWFPVFDFKFNTGKRASHYYAITQYSQNNVDTVLTRYTWTENSLSGAVKVPLNLSRGKHYQLLQPEIRYEFTFSNKTASTPSIHPLGNYHSISYRLYYHHLIRQSYQDVWPNFGLVADARYYHTPFGNLNLGTAGGGQAIVYLPGLSANHGIRGYAGTQKKSIGDYYSYNDIVRFPRGWTQISTKDLSVFGFDYKFPLLNPDFSLWGLAYLKRLTASAFYDYAFINRYFLKDGNVFLLRQNISSLGIDLLGDINFLRFYAPVQLGVRACYLPEIKDYTFSLLFSIDFNAL